MLMFNNVQNVAELKAICKSLTQLISIATFLPSPFKGQEMLHEKTDIRLHLIRHAESVKNTQPHLIGGQAPDTPLTELGRKQAKALGVRFARDGQFFTRMYSSPYVRTMQTTRELLNTCVGKNAVRTASELVEFSQGEWEDLEREDVYTDDVMYRMASKGADFAPPGGESQRAVIRRASGWLEDEILNNPRLNKGPADIALVSHGLTIKCLMQYILGFDRNLIWKWTVDNTSISRFRFDKHGWWPEYVNDTAHLAGI